MTSSKPAASSTATRSLRAASVVRGREKKSARVCAKGTRIAVGQRTLGHSLLPRLDDRITPDRRNTVGDAPRCLPTGWANGCQEDGYRRCRRTRASKASHRSEKQSPLTLIRSPASKPRIAMTHSSTAVACCTIPAFSRKRPFPLPMDRVKRPPLACCMVAAIWAITTGYAYRDWSLPGRSLYARSSA